MAFALSVRANAVGDRTGTWVGEVWQTGLSIAGQADGGGDLGPVVDELLPSFTVDPSGANGAWSKGTYTLGWEGTTQGTAAHQTAIALELWTFFDALKALMPSDMRLTELRISAIQDTGKVVNGASVFALTTPLVGTATATTQMPPEVAVVASLRTGGRGPRNRGRMYLPLNSATNASGLIASASLTTIVNATKALAEGLAGSIPGGYVSVVHQAGLTYSTVTKVQAGNHWDAQRRRQNALPETRTEASLTL